MDKNEVYKKWASILSGSQSTSQIGGTNSTFDSISFPIVRGVFAGNVPKDKVKEIESRIKVENRDGKIESVLDNKDFEENKLEDDPEYKKLLSENSGLLGQSLVSVKPMSGPVGQLIYMDCKYGGTPSN